MYLNRIITITLMGLMLTGLRGAEWEQLGRVAIGTQFNATVGTDGCIHIITNRYLRVDADGNIVENSTSAADGHMGLLDYFPAIAAGTDGSIHVVTRDYGGTYNEGHTIRYRKRKPDGTWLPSVKLADPSQRNYIVAVTATDDGNAWAAHSYVDDFGATPRFYRISTANTGQYLGQFGSQTMRTDTHIRMEHDGNTVLTVLSDHYGNRPVSMYRAPASTNLPSALYASRWTVGYNEYRQGMVGTHMYDDGVFDLVYGLNLTSTVRFCRYRPDKSSIRKNVLALSGMGRWHCADGCPEPGGLPPIAVVAGTPDKQTVMVVGIKGDATEHLENGELVYTISTDGGATFGPRRSIGKYSHAGDGRLLPRLLYLDNAFYLVYRDNGVGGVSIARYRTGTVVQPTGLITSLTVNDAANAGDWNTGSDLQSGTVQYGDRTYSLTAVPAGLRGADWIRTANDSKLYTGTVATFKVDENADVYVAHNDAITAKPSWLGSWTDTGEDLVNDETSPGTFSLYKKTFAAGTTVSLGENGGSGEGMYTVVVLPASTTGVDQAAVIRKPLLQGMSGVLLDQQGRRVNRQTAVPGVYFRYDGQNLMKVMVR